MSLTHETTADTRTDGYSDRSVYPTYQPSPRRPAPGTVHFPRMSTSGLDVLDDAGIVRIEIRAYGDATQDCDGDSGAYMALYDRHNRQVAQIGIRDGFADKSGWQPTKIEIDCIGETSRTTIDVDSDFPVIEPWSAHLAARRAAEDVERRAAAARWDSMLARLERSGQSLGKRRR